MSQSEDTSNNHDENNDKSIIGQDEREQQRESKEGAKGKGKVNTTVTTKKKNDNENDSDDEPPPQQPPKPHSNNENKNDKDEKKDNPFKYDELKTDIQAILGDMDKNGVISEEIAGILGPIAVTLEKMSKWKKSRLEGYVESLPLTSVATYQRIPIEQEFINGIKKLNPQSQSKGMQCFIYI